MILRAYGDCELLALGRRGKEECTIFISNTLAHCNARLLIRVVQAHCLRELDAQPMAVSFVFYHPPYHPLKRRGLKTILSATCFASCGWLLPVRSLIEFVAILFIFLIYPFKLSVGMQLPESLFLEVRSSRQFWRRLVRTKNELELE